MLLHSEQIASVRIDSVNLCELGEWRVNKMTGICVPFSFMKKRACIVILTRERFYFIVCGKARMTYTRFSITNNLVLGHCEIS